ncbi:MAG TPA: DHHA1 domain-containing protein, partial [Solirubrobacteraceae bacterium]|nr:DHHA1 domain-containing protein [Solirubrobacteraceae bacterium]
GSLDPRREGQASAARRDGDGTAPRERARELAVAAGFSTRFTGYETDLQPTTVGAVEASDGSLLVKLAESPFYPAGGGQVSDAGTIECAGGDCLARVTNVFRVGEDQALEVSVEQGSLTAEEHVLARVDRAARRSTERNHTATHLLHAALRERLGAHVRQAGSYVGPDKLRFDFSHTGALSAQELREVEDAVNAQIAAGDPVRAISTTLDEARRLGAMALFGEKYGEVVRMVQIGDGSYSRELCGGTHVRSTAEIGVFHILSETSSAANVRRIEALTGSGATELLRAHDRLLGEISSELRTRPQDALAALRAREGERGKLEKALKSGGGAGIGGIDIDALVGKVTDSAQAEVLAQTVGVPDAGALLEVLDRVKSRLPNAAILLGTAADGRVHLLASVPPALVRRGVKAGAVVKRAAEIVGGGGGGRDTMAQAGGRESEKLGEAIAAGEREIVSALEQNPPAG